MTESIPLSDRAADLATTAQQLANDAAQLAVAATDRTGIAGLTGGHSDFLMTGLTVFVLACFVGYHVVWRVTPALHSPLMAMTNAISSVIIVGALMAAGLPDFSFAKAIGFVAVALAAVNIFGGFMVTHRMLAMFRKK